MLDPDDGEDWWDEEDDGIRIRCARRKESQISNISADINDNNEGPFLRGMERFFADESFNFSENKMSEDERHTQSQENRSRKKYESDTRCDEQKRSKPKNLRNVIGNSCLSCTAAYLGATLFFLCGFFVPYEIDIPFPVIGNLLPNRLLNLKQEVTVIPLMLWIIHFARRFGETLFLNNYHCSMGCLEPISAPVYFCGFGFWTGLSQNFNWGYLRPHPLLFYPGIVLFTIGEIGNYVSHRTIRKYLNKKNYNDPSFPENLKKTWYLYHLFEVLTWFGYSLLVMTPASITFFGATIMSTYILIKTNTVF